MKNIEIISKFLREMEYIHSNIIINNCRICKKVYRQEFPSNICRSCTDKINVF